MMASSPRMFLWSEVYQGKMCIKPCLYIPSMKDLCFCRMTGVSARDDSIFAAHSMVTPCNSITFPSHGSSVVFRCFSGDLFPSQWNHCFLHWASFKNTCFLRVFSVPNSLDSLCSFPLQALHAELCLRLITHGGYTFTCVCQCVHLVPYVLQGSHGGS